MRTRLSLFIAALGLLAMAAAADDWPQWRGPARDNKVTGFTPPATWPKELKQKWKAQVGEGLASPVLAGDKLFVFAREGDQEVTRCLELNSGKEVWKEGYKSEPVKGAAEGGPKFRTEYFRGPRSSPAVGNGKVVTFGVDGVLTCRDAASGKQLWQNDTKGRPQFYTSTSPVIADGLAILHIGGGRGGAGQLTAFDLATGSEKWKWQGDGPSYGSPVIATIGGTKQVIEMTDKNVVGVSLDDGKLLWSTAFTMGKYPTATPVVSGDTVIFAGTAFAITKSGGKFTAKEVWKEGQPHQYNTPVLKDGKLYGLTGQGQNSKLYCQDAKSGEVLWTDQTPRGGCGEIYDVGPVLVALTSDSNLLVFKPSAKGYEEIAKYKVADTPTWTSPILTGKMVVVKDRDSVIAWSIE